MKKKVNDNNVFTYKIVKTKATTDMRNGREKKLGTYLSSTSKMQPHLATVHNKYKDAIELAFDDYRVVSTSINGRLLGTDEGRGSSIVRKRTKGQGMDC